MYDLPWSLEDHAPIGGLPKSGLITVLRLTDSDSKNYGKRFLDCSFLVLPKLRLIRYFVKNSCFSSK
jgi:hypothetical protein